MIRLPSIRLSVVISILTVCAVVAATQAQAQPASMGSLGTPLPAADEKIQEVADAKARFRTMDFSGALDLLREAVKEHPDRLPPAQLIMALWYSQAKEAAATMGSLERAVVEVPDDPEAFVLLGDIEFQAGRVTAAGLLFDKAHALAQSFDQSPSRKKAFEPRIYAGLAAVAESRASMASDDKARADKEWVAAEGYLNSWLKLDPESAVAMQRLARALFKQNTKAKRTAAYEKLKEAEKADPNVLAPAATMAKFYQEEDEFDNAKRFMDYALQNKPKDLRTRLEAARWCLQTSLEDGQLQQAREHAAQAVRLEEKSLDALILRGVVALFQKEYEQAERYFVLAVLDYPSNFPASNNLALAYCEQDEPDKRRALEYAVNNARQHQQGRYASEAASTYGWVLYRTGRVPEADQVLGRLIRSARVNQDTLYYAARVAAEARPARYEEARQLLERALDTERPFSMRPEAKALLEQLKRKSTGSR
jgi:tetratricopeptide (TPR) repeat protein